MSNTVTAEVIVDLPREQVWERLRDLSRGHYYVAGLKGTRINTTQKEGVGASRTVFPKNMAPMDETVVEWNEGHGFVLKLHRGDKAAAPFKTAEFVYAIEDAGNGRTRFKPALRYTLAGGAFGALLDKLFLHKVFFNNVDSVARNFTQYYESGQPSNPDFRADFVPD